MFPIDFKKLEEAWLWLVLKIGFRRATQERVRWASDSEGGFNFFALLSLKGLQFAYGDSRRSSTSRNQYAQAPGGSWSCRIHLWRGHDHCLSHETSDSLGLLCAGNSHGRSSCHFPAPD